MYSQLVSVLMNVLVAVGAVVLVAGAVAELVARRRTPAQLAPPVSIAPRQSALKRAA